MGGFSQISSRLSSHRAYQHISEISEIGNRWLGSRGEVRARNYLLDRFARLGLKDVHAEEFEYLNYSPKSATLKIVAPVNESLACEPLEFSKNAQGEGEIVYSGSGNSQDLRSIEELGTNLYGKIIVTSSFAPFSVAKLCREKGVAGMVVLSDAPHGYIRRLTVTMDPDSVNPIPPFEKYVATFPGVITSAEAGQRLLSLLSAGRVRVKISHQAEFSKKKTSNIVGVVEGRQESHKKIILVSHYDSQAVGPCAVDNGVGLGSLLELARVFAKLRSRRSIIFIAVSGGEIGLLGASDYVKKHERDLNENGLAVLNIDALCSKFIGERSVWATESLQGLISEEAAKSHWDIESIMNLEGLALGDYYPFMKGGMHSAWIWEYQSKYHPYYHTEKDIIEYIDEEKLAKPLEVNARVAFRLANEKVIKLPPVKENSKLEKALIRGAESYRSRR